LLLAVSSRGSDSRPGHGSSICQSDPWLSACRRAAAQRLTCIVVLYLRRHRHEDICSSSSSSCILIHPSSKHLLSVFPVTKCFSFVFPLSFLHLSVSLTVSYPTFTFPVSVSGFSVSGGFILGSSLLLLDSLDIIIYLSI
jgi:hypothetical protein